MTTTTGPKPSDPRATPAMRQYYAFKKKFPDCVLFFRMGDFYEMFDDDARLVHRALGITLTERTEGVPMAGVPFHSVETYLRRMLDQGHRVAVCEQTQDPKEAKGVVERAVTRVLTPGTLVDDALLEEDVSNNLAAVDPIDGGGETRLACAVVDASTGACAVFDCAARDAEGELARRGVTELLYAESDQGGAPDAVARLLEALNVPGTPRPAWQFHQREGLEAVLEQHGVATVEGFGLADDDPALGPAGTVIRYLRETQALEPTTGADALAHLAPPKREHTGEFLVIDSTSRRALEIDRTMRDGSLAGSLLGVFTGPDSPRTAMGRRMLREWLNRPLARREPIETRQACVATLVEDRAVARELDEALGGVQDAARIAGRLGLGRATPRDLVALGGSLARLDAIAEAIEGAPALAAHLESLREARSALAPLAEEIAERCVDHPPPHLREGGLFRDGVDAELDEARTLQRDASSWLADYQARLVREHDLPGIKVGYNKVFGYYIELTSAQARHAPASFSRKQTLKNAERYITPELKEFEDKVTTAEARAIEREQTLFRELSQRSAAQVPAIGRFAQTVAALDVLGCFARRAARRGWQRPTIADEPILDIEQGRHPALEESLGHDFVPNDAALGAGETSARLALITGPNMAGKSTYIRQVALLVLLAHTGSFIPADRAAIGLTDRIFTRVGADDALHAGQSTFMVEMTEAANILHHATERSLVILDEIGRGTSTLDGLSLAWAIAERLTDSPSPSGRGDRGEGSSLSSSEAQTREAGEDPPLALAQNSDGAESRKSGENTNSERAAGPRTLFATHYHELTALENELPGRAVNFQVAVREWGERIVFLHRILPGRADKSYGVAVARLAGLPAPVVKRARELLESMAVSRQRPAPRPPQRQTQPNPQLGLFPEYRDHPALDELRELDLERLTPMQAFDALRRLRERIEESE